MDDLVAVLDRIVEEGIFCTAAQVSVNVGGDQIDLAVGQERAEINVGSLFNVWCAARPVVPLAVGRLIDAGAINLGSIASSIVGPGSVFSEVHWTLGDVLNCSAPLAAPLISMVNLYPRHRRPAVLSAAMARPQPGYSDYAANVLLAEVIERCTGRVAREFIRAEVMEPAGLSDDVFLGMSPAELAKHGGRIQFYRMGLPYADVPLLHDSSPLVACAEPVYGAAYATARALCRMYASMGIALAGGEAPGMPSTSTLEAMLAAPGPAHPRRDGAAGQGRYVGGFMIGLEHHGYGRALSPAAVGQSGFLGSSFGFHEPLSGVSGAVVLNGAQFDQASIDHVRSRVIAALVRSGEGRAACSPEP